MRHLKKILWVILTAVFVLGLTTGASARTWKIEKVHPYYYSGTMRSTINANGTKISRGNRVTVLDQNSSIYTIQYKKKRYKVPASSVELTGFVTRGSHRYNIQTAEAFVNKKGYSSQTGYLIWVSTYTQHMYIFTGSKHHWKCIKHTACATGRFEKPTPLGSSVITYKMPWLWFNQEVGQGGYYGLRIRGGAIHSWLYNIAWSQAHGGRKLMWNREHYGKPVSSGCVRVKLKVAKWLYDKVPINSLAVVY